MNTPNYHNPQGIDPAEHLKPGQRFLLVGEKVEDGDEGHSPIGYWFPSYRRGWVPDLSLTYRTSRPLPTSTVEEVKTCATTINEQSHKTTDSSPINGPEKPLTNSASDAQTPDTDALHAAFMADRSMPSLDAYFDLLALARKLERERAILKTRIAEMQSRELGQRPSVKGH